MSLKNFIKNFVKSDIKNKKKMKNNNILFANFKKVKNKNLGTCKIINIITK